MPTDRNILNTKPQKILKEKPAKVDTKLNNLDSLIENRNRFIPNDTYKKLERMKKLNFNPIKTVNVNLNPDP